MRRGWLKTLLGVCLALVAEAGLAQGWEYCLRLGYALGGEAPVGLPAEIRSLSKYSLQANFGIGADVWHGVGSGGWGVTAGLHVENRGMNVDARVKNYHMAMVQGGESLEGMFTGQVVTCCDRWMVTVPLQATFDLSKRVRLRLGPTLSYVFSQTFDGEAYGGYIRVGSPTGVKVEIGSDGDTRGSYDFSDDLRRWQVAIDGGVDWMIGEHWGAYGEISWGLNGVFKSEFNTIEQTLYPIYGVIGCVYKI